MIVGDGYGRRLPPIPEKSDPVPVIDADAVLAAAVAPQHFQAIAREKSQVVQIDGQVDIFQLFRSKGMELPRAGTPGRGAVRAVENVRRPLVRKIRNHRNILAAMAD